MMKIIVGIATAGRREQLSFTLFELCKQTLLPDRVVICPAAPEDFDESIIDSLPFKVCVVRGGRGLSTQRNVILSTTRDADIIVFFDDDFYPSPSFLAETAKLFEDPNIVVARGWLLMDGVHSAGLAHEFALQLIENQPPRPDEEDAIMDTYGAYGCNMIIRLAPVYEHGLKFDEKLPLYGWQEDIDFSRTMAPHGRIVTSLRLTGVHLATKTGRTSGLRFGYSQIANPIYLAKKGTMSCSYALKLMSKNLLANLVKSTIPEPWVDRRGRLKGNLIAIKDLVLHRIDPQNILKLN
jgi:GT2 family glycosyltransferase